MIYGLIILFAIVCCAFVWRFYPKQKLSIGEIIEITTPEAEKYHNDCLHPCIREVPEGFCGFRWLMVQTPYYGNDSRLENPILYGSADDGDYPRNWSPICVVCDTPSSGFNSDAAIYYEKGRLFIFWREVGTPLCVENKVSMATVGVSTTDCINFSLPKIYLTNKESEQDMEQSPILIRQGNKYLFYAVHYQYKPVRRHKGLVVWEGTSLDCPNFEIKEKIALPTVFVCDKVKQLKIGNKLFFLPKPLKHNVWHIDLFQYNGQLYLFTCTEFGDNIVLYKSADGKNFMAVKTPLVNVHKSETRWNFRSYFYKPTGFIKNDVIYLYYTTKTPENPKRNVLFLSKGKL